MSVPLESNQNRRSVQPSAKSARFWSNLAFRLAYRVAPRVYLEGFAGANNARDFASRSFQIRVNFFLSRVPTGAHLPVKPIPDWKGGRPVNFE